MSITETNGIANLLSEMNAAIVASEEGVAIDPKWAEHIVTIVERIDERCTRAEGALRQIRGHLLKLSEGTAQMDENVRAGLGEN